MYYGFFYHVYRVLKTEDMLKVYLLLFCRSLCVSTLTKSTRRVCKKKI